MHVTYLHYPVKSVIPVNVLDLNVIDDVTSSIDIVDYV